LDAVTALDSEVMRRRETTALRLAMSDNNTRRARQAAGRLFGLNLDAATQLQLAGEMTKLGMMEEARALLARAQRQPVSDLSTLVKLMLQFQAQKQTDIAVQVAGQVLRLAAAPQAGSPANYALYSARRQAVQVLTRAGKLKELIARAERQLKALPNSFPLLQTLAEYYRAADDRPKLRQAYERMAKLKPDDAPFRMQVGQWLVAAGDADAALDHYRAAFKKDPKLLLNYRSSYEIVQTFQRLN